MKKSLLIALGALCVAGLAGCRGDGGGTTSYGAEVEAAAISKVMGGNVATVNNVTPIIAGQTSELDGDKNDNITVISKQLVNVNGVKAEVIVDWTYEDSFSSLVSSFHVLEGGDTNKVFDFNYPAQGAEAAAFEFTATPKCGTTTGSPVKYTVSLLAMKYVYPEYKLSEILAVKEDNSCFVHVTDAAKGYWESNNESAGTAYMYITTYGKVTYLAPDGNWGLIADGSLYCEIYAGSGTKLNNKYFPGLQVGNWVAVRGEPSNYKGNVQIGYISMIKQVEQGTMVEPASYKTMDEAYINGYHQFNGDMNAIFSVTGTYNGNVKNKNGVAITSADQVPNDRYTFEINVGSKVLVIAMDYHTWKDDNGDQTALFSEYRDAIFGKSVGAAITVKGTLRFVANGASIFTNDGTCQLTPFLSGDIA